MITRVGIDKNNIPLQMGDICRFKVDDIEMEGIITYDEEYFAFCFDIDEEKYPKYISITMQVANFRSIEKIISIFETKDDEYEVYRKLWKSR